MTPPREHEPTTSSLASLAAGLAHELNTPLQYVGDNIHFLAEVFERFVVPSRDAAGGESGTARILDDVPDAIAQTLRGLDHIHRIIASLGEISAADQRRPGESVLVAPVLQEAAEVARSRAAHPARVAVRTAPSLRVWVDRMDLFAALVALLDNAFKALADTERAGSVTLDAQADGRAAVVRVSDDGPGIAAESASRVFEPFFTTRPVGSGSGLGLTSARSLVERHGGTLELESSSAAGTTFAIRLRSCARSIGDGEPE